MERAQMMEQQQRLRGWFNCGWLPGHWLLAVFPACTVVLVGLSVRCAFVVFIRFVQRIFKTHE
jgi:hypothetical protein